MAGPAVVPGGALNADDCVHTEESCVWRNLIGRLGSIEVNVRGGAGSKSRQGLTHFVWTKYPDQITIWNGILIIDPY